MKWSSRRFSFPCKVVPYRPMTQSAKRLKAKFETKHGHYLAEGTKGLKRTKKLRPEDRRAQLASHRSAWRSPFVPVC
ncbi:hypothetical protein H5410_002835 [Solanum commersonii]|uniref:Uncharacterized protein n=1 Tax=Solanum commersonii TaxID=4109 RepID=A0A9J6B312_SOLCO|nr:hypothetical protein H5410_002835 [Solanum commersonii]